MGRRMGSASSVMLAGEPAKLALGSIRDARAAQGTPESLGTQVRENIGADPASRN